MPRRLPSLNALKAFEAAARHESFTRAAEELAVTQGAVSHQVKALEQELGLRLFLRERQRLRLTAGGRRLLEVARDAFDRIAAGVERLRASERSGELTVSTSPNFAAKWLVPRLGGFAAAHSGIELRLSANPAHVDFAVDDVDLAIRHGDGDWPGLAAIRLCREELFPVCAPELAKRLRRPADLKRATLLHLSDRRDWAKWLEAAGVEGVALDRGPVFDQASLKLDAAAAGQGVALARTALADWELRSGRLVRPFALALAVPYAYWIVCPRPKAKTPKVKAFIAWLLAEAQPRGPELASQTPASTSARPAAKRGPIGSSSAAQPSRAAESGISGRNTATRVGVSRRRAQFHRP
jgi:LysR family glycine cleavage system transcriptional activator